MQTKILAISVISRKANVPISSNSTSCVSTDAAVPLRIDDPRGGAGSPVPDRVRSCSHRSVKPLDDKWLRRLLQKYKIVAANETVHQYRNLAVDRRPVLDRPES